MLLETLIFALGFNILMFIPAFFFKTDKLTDMSYALTFIAIILYILSVRQVTVGTALISAMVLIWALRLGIFLGIRIHAQKKDDRFDEMRNSFTRFFMFWFFQGLTVWVILIPAILFQGNYCLGGLLLWVIGILIESFADAQKFKFKQNPKNKGKFIQTGLWKYSRHPNYFGEILCWLGIYIFAEIWLWGVVSPIYITALLLFGTGIPLLEKKADKKWGTDKAYQKYKRKTSLLIPWFKR